MLEAHNGRLGRANQPLNCRPDNRVIGYNQASDSAEKATKQRRRTKPTDEPHSIPDTAPSKDNDDDGVDMTPLGRRRTRCAAGPIDQTGEVTNDGVIDGAEDFVGYIATQEGSVIDGQAESFEDVA
ncbi:hypothetical protein PG999_004526 [Apiospora kogelbergensis]|uniref:DUF5709 domain-containing protein n=1 Tax=Apiospora kogelbergensis TaxID=1337665 RepID=A0AAW0QZH6_9PEZI